MNKYISALLTLGTLLPVMWYNVVSDNFLPVDSKGNLQEYCVTRPNSWGEMQKLCYDSYQQSKVFSMSKLFPRP